MSRIGKQPIKLPTGVSLKVVGRKVSVSGPKGNLERQIAREVEVKVNRDMVEVISRKGSQRAKALHGTSRALIANMIKGVTDGWSKELELVGTGYRAEGSDRDLVLTVGYSHPVRVEAPEGISFEIEKTRVIVSGIDKELVGRVAAEIRSIRPPEPYKGKGIKYKEEVVRRKPGKAAKAQEGGIS